MFNTSDDVFADINFEDSVSPVLTDIPLEKCDETGDSKLKKSGALGEKKIWITVTDPVKLGDGMNAYMVYRITTKTSLPCFNRSEFSVKRRFSDFLGLHDKLLSKYLCTGCVIPPAPEKSFLNMTKLKMIKDSSKTDWTFIERRRLTLENFLNRLSDRPVLLMDSQFRAFLELEDDLPRASSTQTLSSAGVMRLIKNVSNVVGKKTTRIDEDDEYFENKELEFCNMEKQLQRLYASYNTLCNNRLELVKSTHAFSNSCLSLAKSEMHVQLSGALQALSETEKNLEQIQAQQALDDQCTILELLSEYIGLMGAVKDSMNERTNHYKIWKDTNMLLCKKREIKAKLELSKKKDKASAMDEEINDLEQRLVEQRSNYENILETLKGEIEYFNARRLHDFRCVFTNAVEKMVQNQEQVVWEWQNFLIRAKSNLPTDTVDPTVT